MASQVLEERIEVVPTVRQSGCRRDHYRVVRLKQVFRLVKTGDNMLMGVQITNKGNAMASK